MIKFYYSRKRKFDPVTCDGCGEEYIRQFYLYKHLKKQEECMTAMGGSLSEAKKYVDRMRNKRRYMENPEPKKKKRMAGYEADKETQKQGFKDYYDKNPMTRVKEVKGSMS